MISERANLVLVLYRLATLESNEIVYLYVISGEELGNANSGLHEKLLLQQLALVLVDGHVFGDICCGCSY